MGSRDKTKTPRTEANMLMVDAGAKGTSADTSLVGEADR
jgi:hypothetical protein